MSRFRVKLAQWHHHLLLRLSSSYRDHDQIVAERDRWRGEYITSCNQSSDIRASLSDMENRAQDLLNQLQTAKAANESALLQLAAERALRQSADSRAAQYHDELVDSLKSITNWTSKSINHRSIFGGMDLPDDPAAAQSKPVDINQKRFARDVANDVTDSTLRKLYEDLRAGRAANPPAPQDSA